MEVWTEVVAVKSTSLQSTVGREPGTRRDGTGGLRESYRWTSSLSWSQLNSILKNVASSCDQI